MVREGASPPRPAPQQENVLQLQQLCLFSVVYALPRAACRIAAVRGRRAG